MNRRDAATERQVRAADPRGSVWLSANAGSGKTRVLTDRVARLLLDEVSPQHILCLTYTKAAASEMQNRLFKRLGSWAMKEDSALRNDLLTLGVEVDINAEVLARARRLFARAIETPGGLKIQTIHSFCSSLLRRFPLEARVSPQFTEMDDRAAKLLREEIVEELADGPNVWLIDGVAHYYSGEDFSALTREIVKHKEAFAKKPDSAKVWQRFGLDPGVSEVDVIRSVVLGQENDLLRAIVPLLRTGSVTDAKAAEKLASVNPDNITLSDLTVFEDVFLFGPTAKAGAFSAKIGKFPTQKTLASLAGWRMPLDDLMARVAAARKIRISLYSAQKTLALHEFASVFLAEYDTRKQRHGWLDFDDLILKARGLLNDPLVAQWVLFRLDGGIDHILVDEAQDTSPAQWDVIERLAQEFTAGEGARAEAERSIFVVGDKKQSIYSFQGADPDGFDRMRAHFQKKLDDVQIPFHPMQLEYSFRSANPILRLVDTTFQERAGNGLGGDIHHISFKQNMPGRVDLWPAIPKTAEKEDRDWFDPVDKVAENHHSVKLASQIAEQIAGMIGKENIPEEVGQTGAFKMRKVRAGDILILVQRRSDLFHEIIRACKNFGLPIAGADRLKVGAELAVKDISALLSFLATPEDDLSLAAALRSPLFGWTEEALHALAQRRGEKEYLWAALRGKAAEHPDTHAMLLALRDDADYLRPYDLVERILTRYRGRLNLLARLGSEAEDGIDALLSQALSYERAQVPSLTGFLTWLEADDVEIKRQMDSAGDQIRVMTVHGAKGLEAPIVILPDTGQRNLNLRDEIYLTERGPFWKASANMQPRIMAEAHETLKAKQAAERDRLLYVAMTRAEKWLIIAVAGELGKDGNSWYETVQGGMNTSGAAPHVFAGGQGLRLEEGDWSAIGAVEPDQLTATRADLPDWAQKRAITPADTVKTSAPSGLGGAKALLGDAGLDEEEALLRGRRLHRLLEYLPGYPPETWGTLAIDLLSSGEDTAPEQEARVLLAEAQKVLMNPKLAFLFADDALAEVDVSANLPDLDGQRIHGAIDRLLIEPARILAVDFKSNALVPKNTSEVPEGILRQMGAYSASLSQIYPDHAVEVAILWTRTAELMPLSQEAVIEALRRAASP